MIRAGVVDHPQDWDWCGYRELFGLRRRYRLIDRARLFEILEANGKHVLTDAWTSFGVVLGVGLAWSTGWHYFDPICAIVLAIHILFSGFKPWNWLFFKIWIECHI